MSTIQTAKDALYRRLRTRLPLRETECNGVLTKRYRVGKEPRMMPDVEAEAVDAIRECVDPGDRVVILGAGYGVTTVHAARAAGASGRVFAYEASRLSEVAAEAVERNDAPAETTVEKELVGPAIDVYGDDAAPRLLVEDLPDCDVMEMDIEGAEMAVIAGLDPLPDTIIVETHGHKGSSTPDVVALLAWRGYQDIEVREERHQNDAVATVVAREVGR